MCLAFQTAISLAEVDADEDDEEIITVRKEHFEKVVHLSEHFQRYLITMHKGMSDSEMAKRRGLRNDAFDEMPKKGKSKQQLFRNRFVENEDDEEKEGDEEEKEGDEEEEEEDRNRLAKGDKNYKPRTVRSKDVAEDSEEDMPTKSSKGKKPFRYEEAEESEEEPPRRSTKNKKIARSEDEESDEKPTAKPTKSKKATVSEEEEDERPKAKKPPKKSIRPVSDDDSEEET